MGIHLCLVYLNLRLVDLHLGHLALNARLENLNLRKACPHHRLVHAGISPVCIQSGPECIDGHAIGLDQCVGNALCVLGCLTVELDDVAVIGQPGIDHGLTQLRRCGHGELEVLLLQLRLHHHNLTGCCGVVVSGSLSGLLHRTHERATWHGEPHARRAADCLVRHALGFGILL